MPLFLDVHNIEGGVSADDVAGAHQADLATQDTHGVSYKRYWVDEEAGRSSASSRPPTPRSAHTVHREAHGLVADEIYEVSERTRSPEHSMAAGTPAARPVSAGLRPVPSGVGAEGRTPAAGVTADLVLLG